MEGLGVALKGCANTSGQFGNNSVTSSLSPVSIPNVSASQVAAGSYHTCAVPTGTGLLCWGYNYDGQLGIGSTVNTYVPVQVTGVTNATSVGKLSLVVRSMADYSTVDPASASANQAIRMTSPFWTR